MITFFERFGIPRMLLLGFLAVAIFMTGDGFELTFLTKFMVDQGFGETQASLLITVYGLFAALGGWCAGVLAEMFGAKRIMMFGACWWIGIHLLFLGVAIPSGIYPLILCTYALRGIGYPLFIYSFVVLMAQHIPPARLASATGFFWTCFSLGIGVFGAYLPSFIMPKVGEYPTFWYALPFSIIGAIICFFFVPRNKVVKAEGLTRKEQFAELAEGASILVTNPKILICAVIRIVNNLLLYGFPVIMPLYLCRPNAENGGHPFFETTQWMQIWGFVFVVTLVFNTFWGWFMDRFGWVWPMRWFGCAVLAVGSVAFYYVPQWFGANVMMMIVAAIIVGIGTCAFSSLPTIMTLYANGKQGAALSAYNLAAGLTTFAGPGIATLLMERTGYVGVCWTYAGLYVLAFVLTLFIRPKQFGFDEKGHRIKTANVASKGSTDPAGVAA
ncbi:MULTISPECIES: MFS transporter [Bifidobacterium]|jgi:polyol permease family|uniref:MFS transporter n=1 Tax=Bifidobacterium tibiigranuli TaxID=2172043 RepID=A0A5N6RXV9_9BIFI|nr:MFS transporter [Bifidobacterium tibiigranuli]KAE8127256.1 cytochrome C biogenesis protein CcdA [Bifidobacterium tibiigranuli]KAE8129647.1 MFS transporter [Bifidobacterium tibiigranuli]MCH3975621.1 MFS transporter [Bifidobacterium tibiigranuli]MCH4189576.1 MFS transporter [Bifidobacterium tibiigranuli]MCH4204445.1 MFS transporter [Bifidobacterium tibiigranuli]